MTLRVAVVGNCHAQYFSAALGTLPELEVRAVGLAYPGPICFEGRLPQYIHAKQVQAWLDEGERGLVLHQVTADTRLDLYDRITSKRPYPLVKFPYVKFCAAVTEQPTDEDVERDRVYNTGSIEAANYPVAALDRLERMVAEEPILFHYNHFSGLGFSVVFEAMIEGGLADHIPRTDLEDLLARMKKDRGISHMITPVSRARWASPVLGSFETPSMAWAALRADKLTDLGAHGLFKMAIHKAKESGRPGYLAIAINLHKRYQYSSWAEHLVIALLERKHVYLAMLVLGGRIAWEDQRGVLFARALKFAPEIRRNAPAYAALQTLAERHPHSNLPLLLECCNRIRM